MFKRSKKSNLKHVSSWSHHVSISMGILQQFINMFQHLSRTTEQEMKEANHSKSQATACHNKPRSHVLVSSKFKVPSPLASQVPHSVAKTATDSTALVTLSRSSSGHVMHLLDDIHSWITSAIHIEFHISKNLQGQDRKMKIAHFACLCLKLSTRLYIWVRIAERYTKDLARSIRRSCLWVLA